MGEYRIYWRQAWVLMRENKLLTGVSVLGTALAICLIMVIVIVWQVRVADYAPENNRDRILELKNVRATLKENNDWNNSYACSVRVVKECFYPLESAEAVGIVYFQQSKLVSLPDATVELMANVRFTDAGFWRIFDFRFLAGKPYGEEVVNSGIKDAVVSVSVARRLYGTTDVVGREMWVAHVPYTIRAVVADVSRLASMAYGDIWLPYTSDNTLLTENGPEGLLGGFLCYILAPSTADIDRIKAEAERNVSQLNTTTTAWDLKLMGMPDTRLESFARQSIFEEPDVAMLVGKYLLIVFLLLLIPAINMSGLTQSRMRRRMSELGVRKAFGATRCGLLGQVLLENLLQTLLGGAIGAAFSYAAVVGLSGWLLGSAAVTSGLSEVMLNAEMLLNPVIFLLAFLACLVLNLLSAGYPAWRAAGRPIVEALNE